MKNVKILEALSELGIAKKDENLEQDGDIGYYFDILDDAIFDLDKVSILKGFFEADTARIILSEPADKDHPHQLLIYFKNGEEKEASG